VIAGLGLPRFDLGPETLESITHGKALSPILDPIKPVFEGDEADNPAAALFCGDLFAGIAVRKAGTWGYGCVYAAGSP
jgi:hypothetical protein